MTTSQLFTIRPFSKPARSDLKDAFRVYLSAAVLLGHNLHAGDVIELQMPDGSAKPALAWPASEKIQDTVIQTSKTFQALNGAKLGDKISISQKPAAEVPNATIVELSQILPTDMGYRGNDRARWAWFLEDVLLDKTEILSPGMIFENIDYRDERRSFKVETLNASADQSILYKVQRSTEVRIVDPREPYSSLNISSEGIGGLNRQLETLNEQLSEYVTEDLQFDEPRSGGVLLHGLPGTGKSFLLDRVTSLPWRKHYEVDCDVNDTKALRKIFEDAHCHQPSAIIIDDLEMTAGRALRKNSSGDGSFARCLYKQLEQCRGSRVFVIATTKDLRDIDEKLLSPGYFTTKIELPVPHKESRIELFGLYFQKTDAVNLEYIADHTHGYVGQDIKHLVQIIRKKALMKSVANARWDDTSSARSRDECSDADSAPTEVSNQLVVGDNEIGEALNEVQPRAMGEVFVEIPKVNWSDIGGQQDVKESLMDSIAWFRMSKRVLLEKGITPTKGVLLYGPPGCSKTMIAKAIATETGMNFLAVKGPELLNMYVGESERAMREIFRKARAASPSILFFDEIDAIGAKTGSTQQAGVHTVTTMLNELDGIEELTNVFVLAATNHPDVLDPALIRAGRFDEHFYIGLPDLEARIEILRLRGEPDRFDHDVDVNELADVCKGYTGAEITQICSMAARLASKDTHSKYVQRHHYMTAISRTHPTVTPQMIQKYQDWAGADGKKVPGSGRGPITELIAGIRDVFKQFFSRILSR